MQQLLKEKACFSLRLSKQSMGQRGIMRCTWVSSLSGLKKWVWPSNKEAWVGWNPLSGILLSKRNVEKVSKLSLQHSCCGGTWVNRVYPCLTWEIWSLVYPLVFLTTTLHHCPAALPSSHKNMQQMLGWVSAPGGFSVPEGFICNLRQACHVVKLTVIPIFAEICLRRKSIMQQKKDGLGGRSHLCFTPDIVSNLNQISVHPVLLTWMMSHYLLWSGHNWFQSCTRKPSSMRQLPLLGQKQKSRVLAKKVWYKTSVLLGNPWK